MRGDSDRRARYDRFVLDTVIPGDITMSGPVRRSGGSSKPGKPPRDSAWTDEKVKMILMAFSSFVQNQAQKHKVPADQVWDLIRDEILDPQG